MATYQTINVSEMISGTKWDGLQITLYSDDAQTVPIDLDGCTVLFELKATAKAITQSTWSTSDSSITITGADNNIITLVGRNMNIPANQYLGDIDITFPNGDNRTWFRVNMKILQSVTG